MLIKTVLFILILNLLFTQGIAGAELVSCSAAGVDVSTASISAIQKCKQLAGELFASKIRLKSVLIETEKSVSYFNSIESDQELTNLQCEIKEQKCNSITGGTTTCNIKCKFDIAKVESKTVENSKPTRYNEIESKKIDLTDNFIESEERIISFSTIPKCDSFQILGVLPRTGLCNSNPIEIKIGIKDKIIRFIVSGFKPVEVEINSDIMDKKYVQIIFKK